MYLPHPDGSFHGDEAHWRRDVGAPGGYPSNEGAPTPVDCAEGDPCRGVRAIQSIVCSRI